MGVTLENFHRPGIWLVSIDVLNKSANEFSIKGNIEVAGYVVHPKDFTSFDLGNYKSPISFIVIEPD